MFAVPGWSVAADTLKSETQSAGNNAPGSKPRKRKRAGAAAAAAIEGVTASTVADLWASVIEGKKSDEPKPEQAAKRQKKGGKGDVKAAGAKDESGDKKSEQEGEKESETQPKQKKDKKNKKQKQKPTDNADTATSEPTSTAKIEAVTKAVAPPAPKLTPLQASMREKLISARFRHLNETLYTRPSEESYQLFDESPEMFDEYHEGFRRQVKVWPENPVDSFLKDIRGRGRVRQPGKQRPGAPPLTLAKTVLPRTNQECTIADLGCGDARLAEALQTDGRKLRVTVKSFDLQSPSPLVTKADIANLPLPDGSINVAVFCLALMGTNWVDFVEEAYRILHWKGELWIAEIKSRFGPIRKKNAPVTHSVGNRKKIQKAKGKGADDGNNDEDLSVEVDGMEDRRRETDVSAFVEVLKSRGFVPQGDREAIDLSNKMFVKMHFIKAAQPTKGKGAKPQEPPRGRRPIIRKIDPIDEQPEVNEASILKPCVYKIR